jgi:hypothetical protein
LNRIPFGATNPFPGTGAGDVGGLGAFGARPRSPPVRGAELSRPVASPRWSFARCRSAPVAPAGRPSVRIVSAMRPRARSTDCTVTFTRCPTFTTSLASRT